MQQLIIEDIYLPQTSNNRYSCPETELGVQLDMISGRRVSELRGKVWRPSYSYDYLEPEIWRKLKSVLRSGRSFSVVFLPDDSDEMQFSVFLCESLTEPTFAFSRYGKAFWRNIAFTLREVAPHD